MSIDSIEPELVFKGFICLLVLQLLVVYGVWQCNEINFKIHVCLF